jgi:hypothetical protein
MFMSVARNVRQLSSIGMSCSPSWNESLFTTQGARLIHSITWNLYTILTEMKAKGKQTVSISYLELGQNKNKKISA